MITRFYKIINENDIPIYVGLTTQTLKSRFKQHIFDKKLDNKNYKIIEIDKIEHETIETVQDYLRELNKASSLERKYIKEYREKYPNLMNISNGGEWGSQILHWLKNKAKTKNINTYDELINYLNGKRKFRKLLRHWINHRTENKCKILLRHWINHRTENKYKVILRHWVEKYKTNKCKIILRTWVNKYKTNKCKIILRHWVEKYKNNKCKLLLRNWVRNRI